MEIFDSTAFANCLAESRYWVEGMAPSLVSPLLTYAMEAKELGLFRPALVGKGPTKQLADSVRKDEILWITDWAEGALPFFQRLFLEVQEAARRELFLPVKRFESHFSVYPPGAFYQTHVDRHRRLPSRVLTLVLYLNDSEEGDGGELRLYPKDTLPVVIQPQAGRLVVFDSRLKHEVCLTQKPRWSLTAWFRTDKILGIEGI